MISAYRGGHLYTHEFRHVVINVHAPGLTQTDVLEGKAPCYYSVFHRGTPKPSMSPRGSH
jgi:hypothetical protein